MVFKKRSWSWKSGLGFSLTGLCISLEKNRWSWSCNLVVLLHHWTTF